MTDYLLLRQELEKMDKNKRNKKNKRNSYDVNIDIVFSLIEYIDSIVRQGDIIIFNVEDLSSILNTSYEELMNAIRFLHCKKIIVKSSHKNQLMYRYRNFTHLIYDDYE